ncbi:hypothetical protein MPER_03479 [Moniliophthora perniciosa FA553]|nr:hypothetical protein MPER_03479 [Moniliophthora perniciosa FA553]
MDRLKNLRIIATYTALGWTADMAEDLIGWGNGRSQARQRLQEQRDQHDQQASVLDEWSDNEITGGNADDPLHGLVHIPEISSGVRLLAPHSVLKTEPITSGEPQSTEGTALQLVFDKTTIPVPRLRRTIDIMGFIHLNAMDFVEGKLLSEAWGTLNIMGKIRVAWALRSHLRQLRKYLQGNKDTAPGPPNPAPAVCHAPSIFGPMIADRGPFRGS